MTQVQALAEQYKIAMVQLHDSVPGSRESERAHERIERICLKADAAGILTEFLAAANA